MNWVKIFKGDIVQKVGIKVEIKEIRENKTEFMDLLLIGDEDESMINRYLEPSTLFVVYDSGKPASLCAVMKIDSDTIEIKNLATYPKYQNKGYASALLDFVYDKYKNEYKVLMLGTGENEITLVFYKKRGFTEFDRVKNFFIDNYSHPIFENGRQLTDMIYLKKIIKK